MRRYLGAASLAALAACSGQGPSGPWKSPEMVDSNGGVVSASTTTKPDAFFISRKPMEGLAECIAWGWRHQAENSPAAAVVASNDNGQRIESEGQRERLELRPGPVNTEVSLYRMASGDDEAMAKRIAVLEACL
ncbi:hypothetical protein [Pigmentiphaga litoralis]|uniref:hypothetical protein n=1 Tax=Pigmentiphaga litoralis TaxID=516702 RepID=UPI00167B98CD|nr:hypothetical protein [Pigmentiphaga litoralis]